MYVSPTITTIGTLADMTRAFNKIGGQADQYSASIPVVGSLVSR